MNVYRIVEDGERKCWQARTAHEAMKAARAAFEREAKAQGYDFDAHESAGAYWDEKLFESCECIGELGNPSVFNVTGAAETTAGAVLQSMRTLLEVQKEDGTYEPVGDIKSLSFAALDDKARVAQARTAALEAEIGTLRVLVLNGLQGWTAEDASLADNLAQKWAKEEKETDAKNQE